MTPGLAAAHAPADVGTVAETLRAITVGVHGRGRRRAGEGAGIIWHEGGLVVTNAHCIHDRRATVRTMTGESLDGKVVAHDARLDLALIDVPGLPGSAPLLGDVETLRTGELLVALGHPFGVHGAIALGVLHTLARDPRSGSARWICADIRLAPGNSGGPLADASGRLVGINTMIVGGLGLAIPVPIVQRFVARVRPAIAA
jgi:serine protease Do